MGEAPCVHPRVLFLYAETWYRDNLPVAGKNDEPWFIDCVCCWAMTYYASWHGYHASWILPWYNGFIVDGSLKYKRIIHQNFRINFSNHNM